MAFRDTWHRALVYFGLAEDHDEYLEEVPAGRELPPTPRPQAEADAEEGYRERPNVRRLAGRRRRDEIDDIFADDPAAERRTSVLRPVSGGRNGGAGNDVRVHLVIPKSFNDAQQIADRFKDSIPVILNLQSSDADLSKRLIDFA